MRCAESRLWTQAPYERERCGSQHDITECESETNSAADSLTLAPTDVLEHGFHGLKNGSSIFMGMPLEPPVLNISAYYLPDDSLGANWTDPRSGQQPFRDKSHSVWQYGNVTYDMDTINKLHACQPIEVHVSILLYLQADTARRHTAGDSPSSNSTSCSSSASSGPSASCSCGPNQP
jgi:hypothetical protein